MRALTSLPVPDLGFAPYPDFPVRCPFARGSLFGPEPCHYALSVSHASVPIQTERDKDVDALPQFVVRNIDNRLTYQACSGTKGSTVLDLPSGLDCIICPPDLACRYSEENSKNDAHHKQN